MLASEFADRLSDAFPGQSLPGGASQGIGQALTVAAQLPARAGHVLQLAATDAFVDGMHIAVLLAGVVALVRALVPLVWLPARAPRSTVVDQIGGELRDLAMSR